MIRALMLSVEIQQLRTEDADVLMGVHICEHFLHRAFGNQRIGIQYQPIFSRRFAKSLVDASRKTDVVYRVVYNLNFILYALKMLVQTLQTKP